MVISNDVDSASSAVIVRLAYIPSFEDPEFLYATVPIAIWSEVEISLAITAGSLPTLRPLYKAATKNFSWYISFLSANKSVHASKATLPIGASEISRKRSHTTSCSESERKIVRIDSEDFVLEDQRPVTEGKFMSITQTTHIHVINEEGGKFQ